MRNREFSIYVAQRADLERLIPVEMVCVYTEGTGGFNHDKIKKIPKAVTELRNFVTVKIFYLFPFNN